MLVPSGIVAHRIARFHLEPRFRLTRRPDCHSSARYNTDSMKARVYVSPKSTVLDPQGQTICHALNGLGYRDISAVRQGKYFEIAIDAATPREQAHKDIDTIAREVLTNPVIEEYRVEFLD